MHECKKPCVQQSTQYLPELHLDPAMCTRSLVLRWLSYLIGWDDQSQTVSQWERGCGPELQLRVCMDTQSSSLGAHLLGSPHWKLLALGALKKRSTGRGPKKREGIGEALCKTICYNMFVIYFLNNFAFNITLSRHKGAHLYTTNSDNAGAQLGNSCHPISKCLNKD